MEIINLETKNTSYQIGIHPHGFLFHLYYGPKTNVDTSPLLTQYFRGGHGVPYDMREDRTFSPDSLPSEYSVYGNGDYRNHALRLSEENGESAIDFRYYRHYFKNEKYSISHLPSSYKDGNEKVKSLYIELKEERLDLTLVLKYGIFYDKDIITRSVELRNNSKKNIYINKIMSASFDTLSGEYEMLHFYGRHFNEMNAEITPIRHESVRIGSRRGVSGHQHNNSCILFEKGTTDEYGSCFGFSFMYSGNFLIEAEMDQYSQTRFSIGLSDEMFSYKLSPSDIFYAPEVIMSYSHDGMSGISKAFHNFINNNVIRGKYKNAPRPILVNNWEATYFDFTGEKLVEIAKVAKEVGIEMFVLDDGWFSSRGPDTKGLGDWSVNEKKMGGTLKSVVDRINALGVKFGLWIEPEMVNEDSDLFRKHPDWAFIVPGKKPVEGRCQLVLDFTREDVREYILESICKVIDSAHIEYVKIDMNRSLCEVFSRESEYQNFGELSYRYMLGVYDFLDKLTGRYPEILFEGCSSGGARFDTGMLYYTPQIWASDNTDATERARIEYNYSYIYPSSSFSSHVSVSPNHQNGRITPIESRAMISYIGQFGYELDLTKMSLKEKDEVKEQIKTYKKYSSLIHFGDMYRSSESYNKDEYIAFNFVSKDKKEALLLVLTTNTHGNSEVRYVKTKGLKKGVIYKDTESSKEYSAEVLDYIGLPLPTKDGEYNSFIYHFVMVDIN